VSDHKNMGGETPGMREGKDRMVKQLVEHGTDRRYAEKVATRCAVRADRRAEHARKK